MRSIDPEVHEECSKLFYGLHYKMFRQLRMRDMCEKLQTVT